MAKSMRCKRLKRLRAIKRDMVEPHYEKKDAAKLAAVEAALAAPKVPVRQRPNAMELSSDAAAVAAAEEINSNAMDLEMADGTKADGSLKPTGGIGKKKKFKVGKRKGKGKFKIRRKNI